MSTPFDYRGKTVFISGGCSGINLGIAQAFASAGANRAVMSRQQDKLDAAVAALKTHGGEVIDTKDMSRLALTLKTREAVRQSVPLRSYGSKQNIADARLWAAVTVTELSPRSVTCDRC